MHFRASHLLPALIVIAALSTNAGSQAYAQGGGLPDPVSLVDPFIGTAGTGGVGLIDDFPGASAPFGMLQWSPDTTSQPPSGGYFYRDTKITGFSLTHLSGAGCSVFGDFGVLPVTGDVRDPKDAAQTFTHEGESASPGYYAVHLSQGIDVSLAAAARSGVGEFVFPANVKSNLLINAASDQAGARDSRIWIASPTEIDGYASSGGFCGMPNAYTVYFAMRFDRPFASYGTWTGDSMTTGATSASGTQAGAFISFDTSVNRVVRVRAAVSYVGVSGARTNLGAGAQTWDVQTLRLATAAAWRDVLGRVRIGGGSGAEQRMFYTALYHAFLSPTLFSDADGSYLGFDGRVHRDARGRDEYSNFSGWDIYRTQMPLVTLIDPGAASDMIESLVDDQRQGGWLPKWPVANAYTGVMGGDSADPIIAEAYAFGARDFDTAAALRAMIKSATDTTSPPGQGWYYTRPGLAEYLKHGYVVNTHTTSVSSVANGASETLEYATDDFAIAQYARAIGSRETYSRFMKRSENWARLYDASTGLIAPRDAEGAFLRTPLTESGQSGFQEGNAVQYTWMVPQGLGSLVGALGGSQPAIARLDEFFSQLNAGQDQPFAWFGNEPTLGSPWAYLYAGAPYKEEAVTRAAMLKLYAPTPDGLPGNDDLGTMSAWWAWNAMGLYPLHPGTRTLVLGAPLFSHVEIDSPNARIAIDAPQASDANTYVQSLRINGASSDRAWTVLSPRGSLHLEYVLAAEPNLQFGSSPSAAPPNFALGMLHFPPSTIATLAASAQTFSVAPGQSAQFQFSMQTPRGSRPVALRWSASLPPEVHMQPSTGVAGASTSAAATNVQITADNSAAPGLYDVQIRAKAPNGAAVPHLNEVVRIQLPGRPLPLLYGANFSDDTVMPIDPRTLSFGNPIPVGRRPGDLTLSQDGRFLYTANQSSNDVSVVDTSLQKTVATIPVGNVPAGIELAPDDRTLWVSNYQDGTLQSIDVGTLKAAPAVHVGSNPEEIAVSGDGSRVYAVLQSENTLAVFDTSAMHVIARIPVGQHPIGIAVSADGTTAYVSSEASDDVAVVDTRAMRTTARISVGKTPEGLTISPDGSLLLVADSGSNQVTPVDLHALRAGRPIPVGDGPFAVVFDSSGQHAFVANSGDGDCSVIDVAQRREAASVPMGSFPIALAR